MSNPSEKKAERLLEIESLLYMHKEGLYPAEIARRLGVNRSTVGRYYMLPTHVGMNRRAPSFGNDRRYAPHTRGDEPMQRIIRQYGLSCSPHTWG